MLARRPTLSGNALLDQVGYCTFEPDVRRAPKAMYRAERFVWLTRLNNLRLQDAGEQRPLTPAERGLVIELPYTQALLTYRQVRKTLKLADTVRFAGLSYQADQAGKPKDPEGSTLFEAKAFQALRKACKTAGLEQAWEKLAADPDMLDTIAWILTVYKTDAEIRQQLLAQGMVAEVADALLHVSFDKFIALSQQALKRILPFMETGQRYDEAVQSAGYAHHGQLAAGKRLRYLPEPDRAVIRNPIVFRALNQARKLVNAIIREYGPPAAIHIELARDLNKPADERLRIRREQDKFQTRKQQDERAFAELFGRQPHGQDLSRWRLYREQNGQCAYSLKTIAAQRLFEAGYTEIDHALPYSRSFDDSQNNKVLVLTAENRNKGNRTPYEYLDGALDSEAWQRFSAWVLSNPQYRQAKKFRLLRKNFGAEESARFSERNLNDTRYICREFKTMLETRLQWHPEADAQPQVVVLAGQLTALLRARWGLLKVREHGDLHHALDAAVIAACGRNLIKRMADHARCRELEQVRDRHIDPETGEILDLAALRQAEARFPMPWPHFRQELLARLSPDPANQLQGLPGYDDATRQQIGPVRVSRAPKRLGTGAAHQETIRSAGKGQSLLHQGQSAVKVPLKDLKLKDLENIVGIERDTALKAALTARLQQFGGDGSKAFADNQPPLCKPSKKSDKAPIVRSVKLLATQKSGLPVRGGIANNGDMLRSDVFSKAGKFYIVPVYVADAIRGVLPNKACTAARPENEWPEMDESYTFLFSLYPNDWVRIVYKGKPERAGYYAGVNRATAAVDLWTHDRNQAIGKQGKLEGNGIKMALTVEKYHVDLLGRLYRVGQETRQTLKPASKGCKG